VLQIRIEGGERCPGIILRNDFPEGCEPDGVREFVAVQRRYRYRLPGLLRPTLCSGAMGVAAVQGKQKAGLASKKRTVV
jgi:hypothetical protein